MIINDMKLQVNYWKVSFSLSFKSLQYDLLNAAEDVSTESLLTVCHLVFI